MMTSSLTVTATLTTSTDTNYPTSSIEDKSEKILLWESESQESKAQVIPLDSESNVADSIQSFIFDILKY